MTIMSYFSEMLWALKNHFSEMGGPEKGHLGVMSGALKRAFWVRCRGVHEIVEIKV